MIMQTGNRAANGISAMMKNMAEQIKKETVDNAPVDTHGLEKAIETSSEGGGRDPIGRFQRVRYVVYINANTENSDGEAVGKYAMIMHEELAPYGSGNYKLGKDSQTKAATGKDVGGKFLERAAEGNRREILDKAIDIARRAIY